MEIDREQFERLKNAVEELNQVITDIEKLDTCLEAGEELIRLLKDSPDASEPQQVVILPSPHAASTPRLVDAKTIDVDIDVDKGQTDAGR